MAETTPNADAVTSPVSRAAWFGPIWWTLAAFGTYFCMYGFRKPFTAADAEAAVQATAM